MKRVVEKVKDIVEICPFTHLEDFAADPRLTLSGYRFTDVTSDLLSKWIDRVVSVQRGQGTTLALAGFRGVGKSHFLAVLAAIISRPELRGGILDPHVASSADRLSRRHGGVVFVRRGAGTSLQDELRSAIGETFGINPGTLTDSLTDLLEIASQHSGETPLVILIDTALGRESRVSRDDGSVLSEMALMAKSLGMFVGVALDDDIAGADGRNSSISSDFTIDYLDQEHLYKIVDAHIFSKHSQMLPVLRDIYAYYREVLPGFRWSEQRFTSLYPLHPATLEIAPLIRLYINDFALLGFAADAGVRIMGRPANSLIGLDEVFDSVESKLRLVNELADAFAIFDKVEREVVAKTPVQLRLPAKLILKGLLMLSLNGQGASASEIAASMMVFSEGGMGLQGADISALLDSFVDTFPGSIDRTGRADQDAKYCLRLSAQLDGEAALATAARDVPDDVIWNILSRVTADKFSDFDAGHEFGSYISHCSVEWRGSIRRGEISWFVTQQPTNSDIQKETPDWTVSVLRHSDPVKDAVESQTFTPVIWRTAELSADDRETIGKLHLLNNDAQIRGQFGDGLSTLIHVHSIATEKIWQRVFFEDGSLFDGDAEYLFSHEARSAHSLAHMLSQMLDPIFEMRYPEHPTFRGVLGVKEAANLIAQFFGGSGSNNAETMRLAEAFAVPLGLAIKDTDGYQPAASELLNDLDIARLGDFASTNETGDVIPIAEIESRLHLAPLGLSREARHLVLAAFVAQRQYEFVTSNGNRINHRSLDLQIIWDDIIGIARPLNESYAPERLLTWAKLITDNSAIKSLDRTEDRLLIIDSLSHWLESWKNGRVLAEFDALPDENLTAGIWRTAANLRKSFGAMAETIDQLVMNDISLDECLRTIADVFSDIETEYEDKKANLRILREFTAAVAGRRLIADYLAKCELTDLPNVERARVEALTLLTDSQVAGKGTDELDSAWNSFKAIYADHYTTSHDALMRSSAPADRLKEILSSNEWFAFESFSSIPIFDNRFDLKTRSIVREIRQLHCGSATSELLKERPYCDCTFMLSEYDRLAGLTDELGGTIREGLENFRTVLTDNRGDLVSNAGSSASGESIKEIISILAGGGRLAELTGQEVRVLLRSAENVPGLIRREYPAASLASSDHDEAISEGSNAWGPEVEAVEILSSAEQ